MPTVPTPRRRTIAMPKARSRQIAAAAAFLDVSGEDLIQSSITAMLISLAEGDTSGTLKYAYARAAGVEWDTLAFAAHQEALANLIATPKL